MKKAKKWIPITIAAIIIIIAILSSSFMFISAAFYRGSLVSDIESEDLSTTEIANIEKEISSTGTIATTYTILAAAIIISCVLFFILLKRKTNPSVYGFIGIAISCFAITQIIITMDMIIFIVLSLPGLILGVLLIISGFSKNKSLKEEVTDK